MKQLLKKLGIPALALGGMLALTAPTPADAAVHFGIGVGVAPVYPSYVYPYTSPYYNPYYEPYAYPYTYGYAYPEFYWGGGWGGHHYGGNHFHGNEFHGHALRGGEHGYGR